MNREKFRKSITEIFTDTDEIFFQQIEIYKNFLQEYNHKMNLTRLDSEEKIYSEYFYESVVPYKDINFKNAISILDVGSGSGIPGIVLKLLYPHIQLTIIESSHKKCVFLNELIIKLNIDVKILNQRAEIIRPDLRESFDLVTSRAVAPLLIILELSLPYLKIGGICIEPKSKNGLHEIIGIETIINKLGGKLLLTKQFTSINNKLHVVINVKKIKHTNIIYPRN
jgi:16S rRNA (guanine527-N7)-methyltransferase